MNKGFTIVEVAFAIAMVLILTAVSLTAFVLFLKKSDLDNAVQEIASFLKLAQNETISFKDGKQRGIYFDNTPEPPEPDKYTFFRGSGYAERDVLFDKIYFLPENVTFSNISLQGGNEVVFKRLTGATDNSGSITLELHGVYSSSKTFYISNLGIVGFQPPQTADDSARIKDTRHVHINYLRTIVFNVLDVPCTGETIDLYFDGSSTPQSQISICEYLAGGQFLWEGTVNVPSMGDQTIKIHTHLLNDPENNTQFSVQRDGRLNNASLLINLSGDLTGAIADYSADGVDVDAPSIYATVFSQ